MKPVWMGNFMSTHLLTLQNILMWKPTKKIFLLPKSKNKIWHVRDSIKKVFSSYQESELQTVKLNGIRMTRSANIATTKAAFKDTFFDKKVKGSKTAGGVLSKNNWLPKTCKQMFFIAESSILKITLKKIFGTLQERQYKTSNKKWTSLQCKCLDFRINRNFH